VSHIRIEIPYPSIWLKTNPLQSAIYKQSVTLIKLPREIHIVKAVVPACHAPFKEVLNGRTATQLHTILKSHKKTTPSKPESLPNLAKVVQT